MEVSVNELVMISGKSKDQCTTAIRLAYGNPDRAFELLMSGAPLPSEIGEGGFEGEEGEEYGDEEGSADIGGANPFAALAQNPNFALIRQRILQDPNFYQQFMQ